MEKKYFEISWNSLWRVLVFVISLFLIYLIKDILILLFLAVVIAAVCQPFVDYLHKKKIPRFLGSSFIFILILAILGIFLWLVIPLIISQFGDFIANFDEIIAKIGSNNVFGQFIQQLIPNFKSAFELLVKNAVTISNFAFSIFGGIFTVLTCLVLAFYLTLEEREAEKFFRAILPDKYENRIISIFDNSNRRIGHWFQGRVLISLILFLLCWLGLYFLGVKYSATLGLLNGVLDIIPFVGPVLAGLIAFFVALTGSWTLVIWTTLFLFIVHYLNNILFTPLIIGKTTGLNSLVVLIALLVGAQIAGFIGFILAIPAAIIIQEIFRAWENSTSQQP